MRKVKYYKCPECGKKYKTLGGWSEHMDLMHPESRPEGFTNARYFYYTLTGRTEGRCIQCKNPTDWNEETGKYERFCKNPKCKAEYVKIAKKRMRDKYGKEYLLDDPEMQRKMLAAKKISGEYSFSNGSGKIPYVGSYEKDFLMMMDKFMGYSATDIMGPSPHTYFYEYDGKKHFYIPDYYIPDLNLEIEIKTQDNKHPKIQKIDKVKEKLKDEMMTANKSINYMKIDDKNYNGFFEYLLQLKDSVDDSTIPDSVKKSAEYKAATESAYEYYDDEEEVIDMPTLFERYADNFTMPAMETDFQYMPEMKEKYHPVIFFFGTKSFGPVKDKVGNVISDKFFKNFSIILNPDPYENEKDVFQYEIYGTNTNDGYKWNCEDHNINSMMGNPQYDPKGTVSGVSFISFFKRDDFLKIADISRFMKAVHDTEEPGGLSDDWDRFIRDRQYHTDKYRLFCHNLVCELLKIPPYDFDPNKFILFRISEGEPIKDFLAQSMMGVGELLEAPSGPFKEKPMWEEKAFDDALEQNADVLYYEYEHAFSGLENLFDEENDFDEAEESFLKSNEDYVQNLDKWKPGPNNILYITGHSGSGKTTLAEELERDKGALMFEFDGIEHHYDSTNSGMLTKLEKINPAYKNFAKTGKWELEGLNQNEAKLTIIQKAMIDIINICHEDSKHLYVIEGIQIFGYMDPKFFENKPMIIKGTSAIKSYFRARKRNGGFNPNGLFSQYTWQDKSLTQFKNDLETQAHESVEIYDNNVAQESLLLKTKFNRVKVKGSLSLQKFTKTKLTQDVLDKYKEKCPSFAHCRISNMSNGYLYTDKADNIVGFVNVVTKQNGIKWIQALNIQPDYQGYGLYEQIMKVAVRELGGTDIETPPKNDMAKEVYRKFGFRTYTNETTVHAMTIRSDAKSIKYDAKAKPNAKTMEEAGLHPVYVILVDAKAISSNIIKLATIAPYSHTCISFDSSMDHLYTFGPRNDHTMIPMGYAVDSFKQYAQKAPKAKYCIYVKLVDSKDYESMKHVVKLFESKKTDLRYDLRGAIKAWAGRNNINEKKFFCSGFVSYILNSGKNQVTDKEHYQNLPMDITKIQNIHLVDMGLCKDYDPNYVDKKTKQIFDKHYRNIEKDKDHQPIEEDKDNKKDEE